MGAGSPAGRQKLGVSLLYLSACDINKAVNVPGIRVSQTSAEAAKTTKGQDLALVNRHHRVTCICPQEAETGSGQTQASQELATRYCGARDMDLT